MRSGERKGVSGGWGVHRLELTTQATSADGLISKCGNLCEEISRWGWGAGCSVWRMEVRIVHKQDQGLALVLSRRFYRTSACTVNRDTHTHTNTKHTLCRVNRAAPGCIFHERMGMELQPGLVV